MAIVRCRPSELLPTLRPAAGQPSSLPRRLHHPHRNHCCELSLTLIFQAVDGDQQAEREREAEEALREEREAKEAKELLLREAKEEVARLKLQVRNSRNRKCLILYLQNHCKYEVSDFVYF